MHNKIDISIVADARTKLERIQKSPNYHSFFNGNAIDAFSKVEGSAFAGSSRKRTKLNDQPQRD
ncbi:hypothetical protein [Pseudomonas sp. 37 R 15]|uniref:hypothetical protein n=1 Tax=Pseudomonas sp. 37 R 15 TaxID=1844104 RepID=UPI000812509D|nr:hypothetical protein [Pseudomonas sp. 37 R 15]CRM80097.1 hypothetical protein [Pseudomonas sp. 37 R 15]